jgi:hypothetical protein
MFIEIHDPAGQRHCISSRSFETIGRWLVETYAELNTIGWDLWKFQPRVMVFPSWDPETRESDWIADTRILSPGFQAATPEEFLAGLAAQVKALRGPRVE